MVLLVPFDGSALSTAALERAQEFASFMDEQVVVLTVVPDDPEFARERGWVEGDEELDADAVAEQLCEQAAAVAPDAEFRVEHPTEGSMSATPTMDVVRTIREVAAEVGANIVFVGSENAGRVSTPVTSVGDPVAEDPRYDVHIVRHVES